VSERSDLVVAGAGPAGLAAAIAAAKRGRRVVLLEKAARPGVKILVSGGNRCNLTHDCDAAEIARAFGREGARFLGAALRELGPRELRAWIESLGVPTKVEPGGKVFPVSDRAVDVRDALERELARAGVDFRGGAAVRSVERVGAERDEASSSFVVKSDAGDFAAPRVLIALGGRSYPKTGTIGDGYALLRSLGHSVGATTPALVPLVVETAWVRELSGLTLEDAAIAFEGESRRGALLFTHFGLSGPAPMDLGGAVAAALERGAGRGTDARGDPRARSTVTIDFLPDRARHELDAELRAATTARGERPVRSFLAELLPRRLVDALFATCALPAERTLAQLSNEQRGRLLDALFATGLPVAGTRGFDFAEVTRGGVDLREIDPATMESRVAPGLFVCGELLDLDGPIGGYNFTAAFATGALAGRCAAEGVAR
jgi:predicted Rossmann fold flavoprotein